MRVLHVLGGLDAGGTEFLALQMIAHAPVGVCSELLNTNSSAQGMRTMFDHLISKARLQAVHQWADCDGPLLAWRSFRLCCNRRPNALLIYPFHRPMLWLAFGARLAGVRHVAVAIGNTAPLVKPQRTSWYRLLLWFQRLGVLAVPCTRAIAQSLEPLPPGLRLGPVIANGCDTEAIAMRAAAARLRRPATDSLRVLMVARLDSIKDQSTLLHAFAAACQPGWELQLVGDGPERVRLEALARALGMDPDRVFLGCRFDIPELLGQADLFAFSTTAAEGFGIAMIEAMAAGLPIVASDVPACREVLLQGEAGMLLPAGDLAVWTEKLADLLRHSQLRLDLAGQAQSLAFTYDIKTTAKRWYLLFER